MHAIKVEPLISLKNARIRLRDRIVLEDITWRIGPGEHWVLIGPNGAGKTSLGGAVRGTLPVVGGRIDYGAGLMPETDIGYLSFEKHRHQIDLEQLREEARSFSGGRMKTKTVRELLAERRAPETARLDSAGRQALIRSVGLQDLIDRPLSALSMGEMRKILLFKELLPGPRLLILDEPFDGLDASSRRHFTNMFEQLMRAHCQLIWITHRMEEIPATATHILVLRAGRMLFCGSMAQFQSSFRIDGLYESRSDPSIPAKDRMQAVSLKAGIRDSRTLIRMQNVTVSYGAQTVFKNLNWTMRDGENWIVHGPNGSGKTTLLRLIAGEHPQAYANRITLFGRRRGSGETIWQIKHDIGWISAEFQFRYRKTLTAADVVMSGFFDSIGLYRRGTEQQRAAVLKWMQRLDIAAYANIPFDRLSHGQQRLVLLARAMVKSPQLLILDEPCQGLDPGSRAKILALLNRIGSQTRTNILYVTHHADEWLGCLTHVLGFQPSRRGAAKVIQKSLMGAVGRNTGSRRF
jgi:molybdate transport system ATP-binding protein